jgi:hypothetical protein
VFGPQPKTVEWIRRVNPHISYNSFWGFDDILQTEMWHIHLFEIQPKQGGRFGIFTTSTRTTRTCPFVVSIATAVASSFPRASTGARRRSRVSARSQCARDRHGTRSRR